MTTSENTVTERGPMEQWAQEHRECFISANRAGWWGDALTFAREQDTVRALLRRALLHAAHRTHPANWGGCDGCADVQRAIEKVGSA